MNTTKLKIAQQIYERLARLEKELSTYRFQSAAWIETSNEIDALRKVLQDVLNTSCPVLK
jgi:hypothetical protein